MAEEKKNIPKLRFREFTGDNANAWELRKLGEVGKALSGVGFPNSEQGGKSGIPFYKVSDMNIKGNEHEMTTANNYVTNEQISRKKWTPIKNVPAIFFAKVGAAVLLNRKRLCRKPFLMDNNTMAYSMDQNYLNADFSKSLFETINLASLVQVGALPSYNAQDIENIKIAIPNLNEQKKIACYFKNIDSLIALHQRMLDEYKTLKKTMLSKMFPKNSEKYPELRFSGFTDAWELRKLGEVARIVGGGTPKTSIPEYWNGEINWYSPVEIGKQTYVYSSQKKITELGLKKSSAKILPVGTILFTSRAGIGNTAILSKEATTNQGFQSIVPDSIELDSYFIYSRSSELKKYGEKNGAGSTFIEVSGKEMEKMPIYLPKLIEQQKIGSFFRHLDELITLHQRELELLKTLKKTMLQQMFV